MLANSRNRVQNLRLAIAVLICALLPGCTHLGPAGAREQVTFAQNGDAKLRVFVEGSGPTIVLLSGQGRGPRDLDGVAQRLVSAGHRVIRMDPRGFGESVGPVEGLTLRDNAADVRAVIEKFDAAPAIVAGWAYGNRVARFLARERPELIRGVVLMAAGGKIPPKPDVAAGVRVTQDKSVPPERRAEAARAVFYGPNANISASEMLLDHSSDASIKAQSTPSVPLEAWWDGGMAPMLVLQGLNDVVAPPENGRSLQRDYPDRVTLVEFAGVGHRMVHERPDLVAGAITTWARKLK